MIKECKLKIVEDNMNVSKPTLFCMSDNETKEKVYVLRADSQCNPCDYCENIFYSLKKLDVNITSLFIDLKDYYGSFTDSWLWKCCFVKDKDGLFYDVTFDDILSIKLTKFEDEFLKEYFYKDEISMCV